MQVRAGGGPATAQPGATAKVPSSAQKAPLTFQPPEPVQHTSLGKLQDGGGQKDIKAKTEAKIEKKVQEQLKGGAPAPDLKQAGASTGKQTPAPTSHGTGPKTTAAPSPPEPEVTFEEIQALEEELERLKRTEQDLQDYSLGTRPEREQEEEL